MHHSVRAGIVEGIEDRRDVVDTPLSGSISLVHLISDEVTEHGKLVGKIAVDADNFLPYVCRRRVTADELGTARGQGEDASTQKRGCVGRDHASGDLISWKWLSRCDSRRRSASWTVRPKTHYARRHLNC